MVVVKKPQSNKLCICTDPRDLNQSLQRPHYPQPTIEDILRQLSKAAVFSMLDSKDGFWQVKLDKESSYLTIFWYPFERLRWLRMPLGINTAPEEYQKRQTERVLDLPGVAMIADDHLEFDCGNTMEETCKDQDNNLRGLLEGARKIRMQFNSVKMRLRHEEVRYLGNLISGETKLNRYKIIAAVYWVYCTNCILDVAIRTRRSIQKDKITRYSSTYPSVL